MKLIRIAKGMIFLTVLALIYIHMQMQIYDLAYEGKSREKLVRELKDRNGTITYNILKLKSSNHLGDQLLEENSELRFLDNENVVEVETTNPILTGSDVVLLSQPAHKQNRIFKFFSLRSAQARPQE
jgi:cell division protein FtsL